MPKYTNLRPDEFLSKIHEDPNAVILDVRTGAEYKSGHLPEAINVSNIHEEYVNLDKDKSYYLHCRVGGRSAVASQILISKGFENVFNLNGSIDDLKVSMVKG